MIVINILIKIIMGFISIVIYSIGFTLVFFFQLIYIPVKLVIVIFKYLIGIKPKNNKKIIKKELSKKTRKRYINKSSCISDNDLKIAKRDRMTLDEFIEAEERDDDNLDYDDT